MEKVDDAQLILEILSGNDSAFNTLVEKYHKTVHALIWRKVGNFHDAEEITQDVFLQAYNKLSTLRNPNLFAGWLYVIANRLCLNWLRRQKLVTQPLQNTSINEIEKVTYEQYISEQRESEAIKLRYEIVEKLLERLPESERRVLELHYLGEMTTKEIGNFLGRPVNTITSQLQRARKRLQGEEAILIREILGSVAFPVNLSENNSNQKTNHLGGTMNYPIGEFIRTDFGHEVYDSWYLEYARYNFEPREFVEKNFSFYEKVLLLSKNDRILEAGCGIGSYSRAFARHGYHVVGMDLSPNFLLEAQKITQREKLEIEFILGDYNGMSFEEKFSVIFFEGAFFYKSQEGLMSLLNRIHRALTLNGRIYFVHPNQSVMKKQYPMANWDEIEKNVFVLESGEYDERDDVGKHTWLKIDLKTQKHYKCDYSLKHLPPNELKNCLVEAGFTDIHFYKKRRLGDFHPEESGFSVVARK